MFVILQLQGFDLLKLIYSEKATEFLRNLHRRFDRYYIGQIYGGDFTNIVAFSEYMNSMNKS